MGHNQHENLLISTGGIQSELLSLGLLLIGTRSPF